ncbi:hypothetical protein Vafri_3344 [Volvox africanus]|uniref:Uncharacterized protein n=1 Tax=Volvox africanus TaxID=51714 RepID=A0A8J4ASW7_9CHLO|nr:hypothetical protein Vafri_3344 [Volvox africanus]
MAMVGRGRHLKVQAQGVSEGCDPGTHCCCRRASGGSDGKLSRRWRSGIVEEEERVMDMVGGAGDNVVSGNSGTVLAVTQSRADKLLRWERGRSDGMEGKRGCSMK